MSLNTIDPQQLNQSKARARSNRSSMSLEELKATETFQVVATAPEPELRVAPKVAKPQPAPQSASRGPSWINTFYVMFAICAVVMGSITVTAAWSYGPGLVLLMVFHVMVACVIKAGMLTAVICSKE